ncbi:MAG TPA: hypothetical protein VFT04_14335 [Gemmatimonadales bacterium]|nr:hypothetical protein [Gemmatimonadales bacterium]
MEKADPVTGFEPRRATLVAAVAFLVPVLVLCWPIAQGYFLGGLHSDQYVAGYAFRLFGAERFLETGRIPQWNPYLFGGMPFIAASSGDIFYPTAWLRWIMPVGTAMALGFAVHLFLAGLFAHLFLRALRCSWSGALVGGLAYELTGILASLAHPGHDGKLFVSALAPLLLLALTRAIRDRRHAAYGFVALTVGLCILTPHPQMTYYLLLAAGIWTLYLTFFDPERPQGIRPVRAIGLAALAVVLGVGIGGIFVVPFLSYFPYSPRVIGDSATSWEYATSYALPIEELFGTVLPHFNGLGPDAYWGRNFAKLHSEYLGVIVVALAGLGVPARRRQRGLTALAVIAGLFLLISLGGHTPFYRLWYEVMPFMKKVRAPGMAFFLVALPVATYAAFGADRLLRREAAPRTVLYLFGGLAVFALLGVTGILQSFAEGLAADPRLVPRVQANASALAGGSFRLLIAVLAGGAVAWAAATGRLAERIAALSLAVVVTADLISVDRHFYVFEAPASELFAADEVTAYLAQQPKPYRVMAYGAYPGDFLMAHRIPTVLGYHGNEVRFYDEVWGGKNVYANLGNWNLWDLWAVGYAVLPDSQAIQGFHRVMGPVQTTPGRPMYLYARDTMPPYARVVPVAAKVPEAQLIPTILDPRFPLSVATLFPESTSVAPPPIEGGMPVDVAARAAVTAWEPGRMTISVDGAEQRQSYLVVAETWYPAWHATVDGNDTPVHRANHAQIAVEIPSGARSVELRFDDPASGRGRMLTLVSLLLTAALTVIPSLRRRTSAAATP